MIDADFVLAIHEILIEEFGGSKGLRDRNLLESAILRPYTTFDQKELYPTVIEKAAALFESLVTNHPFIDGNKRIAYVMLRMTLLQSGQDLYTSEESKYEFVIKASEGKSDFNEIVKWIEDHLEKKNVP